MKGLKMMWFTSGDNLVCRWVDAGEQEKTEAISTVTAAGNPIAALTAEPSINQPGLVIGRAA